MIVQNGRQLRRLAKLLAKPGAKLGVVNLLNCEANASRENLPDTLLSCSPGAMMHYARAEFVKDMFKAPLV